LDHTFFLEEINKLIGLTSIVEFKKHKCKSH